MQTEHLQIFASVYKEGSLSAAARVHGLDASRVSRIIQLLETDLAVPLFRRNTRRLAPTEAGRLYYAEIAPVLDALTTAQARINDLQHEPAGKLRVSAPVSFGLLNVVPWLPAFQARYPGITLDLRLHDGPPVVGADGVDVAVALGPLTDSDLIAVPLAEMRTHLCASPAYLSAHGHPLNPADVAQHAALVLQMPGFDDIWRFRCGPSGPWRKVPVRPVLRTSNAIALKDCALAGQGLIVQAGWILGRELREGRLVELLPEWTVRTANFNNPAIWLLHAPQPYLPQKVRVFIAHLRERFKSGCPWEQPDTL